jgi:tetratricopeptide (TPR) repeat protein
MADPLVHIDQARKLIQGCSYDPAERTLQTALKAWPKNADLNALLGILYCLTQREDEAPACLAAAAPTEGGKLTDDARRLGQMLVDYSHCRTLMAKKIGAKDDLGPKMTKRIEAITPLKPGAGVGIKISACMIVKNEEKHLDRCLKSLKGLVDEIVVVDTGSTDRTVEIAESYGAKIGRFEWCNDFAMARNESLRLATGHWALWIDADEEVAPEGWNAIREAVIRPHYGGYFITIVNYMAEGNDADQYVHSPVRLFRLLPGVRFDGRIHEQVMPSIIELGLPFATLGAARIFHYGYQAADMDEKGKLDRAITMLEREVREFPEDGFHWFNLTNAFSVGGRHKDVVRAGRVCLNKLEPGNRYTSLTYHLLMGALIALGRFQEAMAHYDEAVAKECADILVEFQHAQALLALNRFDDGLAAIDRCMSLEWPRGTTGDYGIVTHKSHTLKGKVLLSMGRFDEALELFEYSLSIDPMFSIALQGKGLALESMGHLQQALATFQSSFGIKSVEHVSRKNAARVLVKMGRAAEAANLYEEAWRGRPEDHDAWVGWVQACEKSGDVQCVVRAYAAYAEGKVPSTDLLVGWGRALDTAGQPERALHCFTEAIKRDPNMANAYFNSGDLLYRMGHYADAAHLYEQGLRIEPHRAQGWFVMGNSMAQLGLLEGAASAYREALAIEPRHAEARNNLEVVSEAMQAAA